MLEMVAVNSVRQDPHPGTLGALKDTGAVKSGHPSGSDSSARTSLACHALRHPATARAVG
jgi:hypothetical protein